MVMDSIGADSMGNIRRRRRQVWVLAGYRNSAGAGAGGGGAWSTSRWWGRRSGDAA